MSPEDLVLSKLTWAQQGGSETQLRDVREVIRAVHDLDRQYIAKWAGILGVSAAAARAGACAMKSADSMSMDTTPETDSLYRSLLMGRSGAERLCMGAEMFEAARALVTTSVRADAAALTDADLRVAVFARVYAGDLDEQTMAAVADRVCRSR